jgi:hypothetical protein
LQHLFHLAAARVVRDDALAADRSMEILGRCLAVLKRRWPVLQLAGAALIAGGSVLLVAASGVLVAGCAGSAASSKAAPLAPRLEKAVSSLATTDVRDRPNRRTQTA